MYLNHYYLVTCGETEGKKLQIVPLLFNFADISLTPSLKRIIRDNLLSRPINIVKTKTMVNKLETQIFESVDAIFAARNRLKCAMESSGSPDPRTDLSIGKYDAIIVAWEHDPKDHRPDADKLMDALAKATISRQFTWDKFGRKIEIDQDTPFCHPELHEREGSPITILQPSDLSATPGRKKPDVVKMGNSEKMTRSEFQDYLSVQRDKPVRFGFQIDSMRPSDTPEDAIEPSDEANWLLDFKFLARCAVVTHQDSLDTLVRTSPDFSIKDLREANDAYMWNLTYELEVNGVGINVRTRKAIAKGTILGPYSATIGTRNGPYAQSTISSKEPRKTYSANADSVCNHTSLMNSDCSGTNNNVSTMSLPFQKGDKRIWLPCALTIRDVPANKALLADYATGLTHFFNTPMLPLNPTGKPITKPSPSTTTSHAGAGAGGPSSQREAKSHARLAAASAIARLKAEIGKLDETVVRANPTITDKMFTLLSASAHHGQENPQIVLNQAIMSLKELQSLTPRTKTSTSTTTPFSRSAATRTSETAEDSLHK